MRSWRKFRGAPGEASAVRRLAAACFLRKSLLPEGMEETLLLEAPSLENIMQYLTKEAVRR